MSSFFVCMKNPKIFVIILNYNGGDGLRLCLDSVYKLNYPNFEVVVVDNNSSDNSFEEARRRFRKFHFIKNNHNIGFAGGNNVAIKWALEKMAEYVFLLNNDAIIEKNTLTKMVEAMEQDQDLGISSPIIYQGESDKIWFAGGKINWLKMKTEHNDAKRQKTDYITGCAMLIRKNVFAKIGLLDERFFLYYEDADFSYRTRKNGFGLIIISKTAVYHLEKSSENLDKVYWLVLSGVLFFKKNASWYLKPWISFYLLLRTLKNRIDLRNNKTEIILKIQKAYRDSR